MLKMIVSGALGRDAEIREVGKKKAINFNVGVSMNYKDQQGNKVERTEWVKAVIWKNDGQSTKVAEFLKKGQKVLIEGTPSSEGFKGKEGDIKSALNINVKELEFVN
jgi:single-strand DNA-binding protein